MRPNKERVESFEMSTTVLNDLTLAAVEDAVIETASSLLDESDFRLFYERTSRQVWAYLMRLTGDRQLADDLLQETYYRFYRASASYENESHRRNALFMIATNLSRDSHRKTKGVELTPIDDDFVSQNDETRGIEARTDLARAMQKISPQQREMLILAYAYGSSHQEIAAAVGVADSSVKSLLLRARRKLAGILSGNEKGGDR